jgi:pyridoxamine 5'-phosphate oxidase
MLLMNGFGNERSDYRLSELEENDLVADPLDMLRNWLDTARDAKVREWSAMCVSTVSADHRPSSRFVLSRGVDSGVIFYTNYLSRKGHEIEENPSACANFWWADLERQVRIEGQLEKLSLEESDAYFMSRPPDSRVASAASPQSQIVPSREHLESLASHLDPETLTRPDHWGGYRLVPDYFEFWQGRKARLHDRFAYVKQPEVWLIHRLAP